MKKTFFTLLLGASCLICSAQAPFGFGGKQLQGNRADSLSSKVYRDINYVGDGEEYHNLDIYLPKTAGDTVAAAPQQGFNPFAPAPDINAGKHFPVVIHIYGSAWFSNNSKGMADINTICASLLEAGYAVVCPNHRSSMDAKWPAQINDIKAVVRFLRAKADKFHLDPNFIGVSGFSSGAHLASVMATSNGVKVAKCGDQEQDIEGKLGIFTQESSFVNACCEWSGPVDAYHMDCDGVAKNPNSPEVAVMGMDTLGHYNDFAMLSAQFYVDSEDVPVGIFHGIKDNVVPVCQGERFYECLQQHHVPSFLVEEPEGGHGFNMYNEANLHKMVEWFDKARLEPKSAIVEEGGTGNYPAVMKEEATLEAHTIFCPQDLSKFGKKNLLPILVWGNGACYNSPFEHYRFLNEIASQGYLVIATGYFPQPGLYGWNYPRSTSEQQIQSIDWAFAQNNDKNSPYYHKLDLKHICLAGMSCGGLQTLDNCQDPRLSLVMIMNSGLFTNPVGAMPNMPMPNKEKLNQIHTPILYILGGTTDIAYNNGMDDFHRIQHVPAAVVNYPVGHGGTYGQPHGGEFRIPAIAWLNWQLKGDKEAAKLFVGDAPALLQRKDWTLEHNELFK